jgi:hypothetical protein
MKRDAKPTLRSKTPEMAQQEIWALLLTHYAVRAFMQEAADTVDLDPDRLSPIRAINIIRRSVTDPAEFSPAGKHTTTDEPSMNPSNASPSAPPMNIPTRPQTRVGPSERVSGGWTNLDTPVRPTRAAELAGVGDVPI